MVFSPSWIYSTGSFEPPKESVHITKQRNLLGYGQEVLRELPGVTSGGSISGSWPEGPEEV